MFTNGQRTRRDDPAHEEGDQQQTKPLASCSTILFAHAAQTTIGVCGICGWITIPCRCRAFLDDDSVGVLWCFVELKSLVPVVPSGLYIPEWVQNLVSRRSGFLPNPSVFNGCGSLPIPRHVRFGNSRPCPAPGNVHPRTHPLRSAPLSCK